MYVTRTNLAHRAYVSSTSFVLVHLMQSRARVVCHSINYYNSLHSSDAATTRQAWAVILYRLWNSSWFSVCRPQIIGMRYGVHSTILIAKISNAQICDVSWSYSKIEFPCVSNWMQTERCSYTLSHTHTYTYRDEFLSLVTESQARRNNPIEQKKLKIKQMNMRVTVTVVVCVCVCAEKEAKREIKTAKRNSEMR